jgi:hypothetical protein
MIFKINTWFYLSWNWLELVLLVIFTYLIRNVRDELNISLELFLINMSWIFFSMMYMGFTFKNIFYLDERIEFNPPTYVSIIIISCI